MEFKFKPMSKKYAMDMIINWKYEGEYSIYNYENEKEHILDSDSWGIGLFAVLNEKEELIGELTIEFFDEKDEFVENKDLESKKDESLEIWIGFGLRSDLTGKGLGSDFVCACTEFAKKKHRYEGKYIRLGVAEFNKRAIKTYKKVGFERFQTYESEIDGKKTDIIWMRKEL